MKERVSMPELDFEYKLWKNRLVYFETELQVYLARLMAVKLEVGSVAGQYIAPLKEMINEIHTLSKEIKLHEEEMTFFKKDYPINHHHTHYQDFISIRSRIRGLSAGHSELIADIDRDVQEYIYV